MDKLVTALIVCMLAGCQPATVYTNDMATPAGTSFFAYYIEGLTFELENRSPYDVETVAGRLDVYRVTYGPLRMGSNRPRAELVDKVPLSCQTPIPACSKIIVECDGPIGQEAQDIFTGATEGHWGFRIESITYADP